MSYAERPSGPTRALSPRHLPTNHVHAVPTREYQSDQSSRVLLGCHPPCCPNKKADLPLLQKNTGPHFNRQTSGLDRSLHIRKTASSRTAGCADRTRP